MRDTDSLLIGTSWTRSQGSHSPAIGTIDAINVQGPRLKLKDGSHRRLKWAELGFGWFPEDRRSERNYDLWKMADHINYLDEVQAQAKSELAAIQTPIESEITVTTEVNGGAVEIEQTKECHGPWHRHGDKYEQRPLSEFSINTAGKNAGQLAALCDSCRAKQRESDAKRKAMKRSIVTVRTPRKLPAPKPRKEIQIVEPVVLVSGVDTPEGVMHRWRILVVQTTEHFVHAKDFLDAAAQVAELGEVTRVEKL